MIKLMALIARKPGLSKQEFIDHYEANHVPLAWRILPGIDTYCRNYVGEVAHSGDKAQPLDFDAITELTFATQADYDAFRAAPGNPDVLKQLMEDEKSFIDRSKTRMIVVDERR